LLFTKRVATAGDKLALNVLDLQETCVIRPCVTHRFTTVVSYVGVVYDGPSLTEAKHQFRRFVEQSKTEIFPASGSLVTIFEDSLILTEYRPPEVESEGRRANETADTPTPGKP
jgi:hypothetical protein